MNDLQKCQLNILKQFIRVCDKYNLRYFLVGGSCLGAIRHQGFIPWDDDIDVGMPREDFEKYITLQKEYEGTNFFIQTYKSDPCYIYNYAKLRDSGTTYIENIYKYHRINHGVWIDIFPIDAFVNKIMPREKYAKSVKFVWWNVYLSYLPALRRKVHKRTFFKDIGLNIIAGLSYIFDINHFRNKRIDKYTQKYNNSDSKMYGNHFGFNVKKEAMDKQIFFEYIKVKFEDIEANVPKQYDTYLTNLYGDYMKFPPIEKQVGHHLNKGFSLSIGYEQYIKEHKI
ncbi:MAG: phosphorylcholine transferase LicD [Bacilli bacterium]